MRIGGRNPKLNLTSLAGLVEKLVVTVNDERILSALCNGVVTCVSSTCKVVMILTVDVHRILESVGYLTRGAYEGNLCADVLKSKNVSTDITLGVTAAVATYGSRYTVGRKHIVRNRIAGGFAAIRSLTGSGSGTGSRSVIVTDRLVTAGESTALSLTDTGLRALSVSKVVAECLYLVTDGNE